MQLILIEPNDLINNLLSLNIKTYLSIDVIKRNNAADAIELINILPEIDLIITTVACGDEQTSLEIAKYIVENNLEIPFIVLGELPDLPDISKLAISVEELNWEKTIEVAAKMMGLTKDILKNHKVPDFVSIPLSHFFNLKKSSCDIYIRIKKGPDNYQHVKRIHQGDSFSKELIDKYASQGLTHFFIEKSSLKSFTTFVSNELYRQINDPIIELEAKINLMADSYDFASKRILSIGFDSTTIQLTETLVSNIISIFKEKKKISTLLGKILNAQSGYIYQHSHLTAIVACEILKNMGIDNKSDHEKIALAALFKDISLVENEHLAKINTFKELEEAKLDEQQWEQVFNHAVDGAVLIRNYPEAPLDVDVIIKHHHASLKGSGFNTTESDDEFDLLSLVFIISVEFVNELLSFKENKSNPRPLLEELKTKYCSSKAKKILKALALTLQPKKSA